MTDTATARVVIERQGALVYRVNDYFRHARGKPLHDEAHASADAVALRLDSLALHVLPQRAGTATVELRGVDPGGEAGVLTFTVEVLGCPIVPEGDASYFPVRQGQTWTYDYTYLTTNEFGYRRTSGELQWTVRDVVCTGAEARLTLDEAFSGRSRSVWRPPIPDPDSTVVDSPVEWTREAVFIMTGDMMYTRTTSALGGEGGERARLRWRYPADAARDGKVDSLMRAGFGSRQTATYTLVRAEGIEHWRLYNTSSRNGGSSESATLRRRR